MSRVSEATTSSQCVPNNYAFLILVDFLKNTWKGLRDNYKRCLTTRVRQRWSGTAAQKLSMCKYFHQLEFLNENKNNNSNIPNN